MLTNSLKGKSLIMFLKQLQTERQLDRQTHKTLLLSPFKNHTVIKAYIIVEINQHLLTLGLVNISSSIPEALC